MPEAIHLAGMSCEFIGQVIRRIDTEKPITGQPHRKPHRVESDGSF
jgi:hypothetical protein